MFGFLKNKNYQAGQTVQVKTDDLIIPRKFSAKIPKTAKMAEKYEYYRRYRRFQSPIVANVVRGRLELCDGYTSYLLAKAFNIKKVGVRIRA